METTLEETLASWQVVFRKGFAPLLDLDQLQALRQGPLEDDERLLQGATTHPPPMQCTADWPIEGACLIGYTFVQTAGGFATPFVNGKYRDGAAQVGECEEFFARMAAEIDQRLGEPAAVRYLLNTFDETPRDKMRAMFLPEVERAIKERLDAGV